jgi:hypothetical protein
LSNAVGASIGKPGVCWWRISGALVWVQGNGEATGGLVLTTTRSRQIAAATDKKHWSFNGGVSLVHRIATLGGAAVPIASGTAIVHVDLHNVMRTANTAWLQLGACAIDAEMHVCPL